MFLIGPKGGIYEVLGVWSDHIHVTSVATGKQVVTYGNDNYHLPESPNGMPDELAETIPFRVKNLSFQGTNATTMKAVDFCPTCHELVKAETIRDKHCPFCCP